MSTLRSRSGAASTTMWPIVVGPSLRNEDNSMRSVSSPTVAPSKQLTNPSSMKTINVIGYRNPSMSSQTSPRTLSLTIVAAAARSTASLVKNPTPVFSRSNTVAAAICGTSAGCCLAISERATTSRSVNSSIRPRSKECSLGMPILVWIEKGIHTRNLSLSKTADPARWPSRVTSRSADDSAPMPAVGRHADMTR